MDNALVLKTNCWKEVLISEVLIQFSIYKFPQKNDTFYL